MTMKFVCNCCGSGNIEFLFSNFQSSNVRFRDAPNDVYICCDCGLVVLDVGHIEPAAFDNYYSTFNHFVQPAPLAPGQKLRRERQVEWLYDRVEAPPTIKSAVDIGHGTGYILKLLKDRGLKVYGVDYSQVMHDSMKKLYGVDGHVGAFSPEVLPQTYDLLVNIQTLEHMLDPNAALAHFNQVLNDGGYLFIEVPDSEFPRWDQLPDFFVFDHLYHFTLKTLGRMLANNGFKIIDFEHVDNPQDSGNPLVVLRIVARKMSSPEYSYRAINDYRNQKTVMLKYREKHSQYLEDFNQKLHKIKKKIGNAPISIYCAGEHTSLLLDRFDLTFLNITCIFDGDPAVEGMSIKGHRILHVSKIPESGVTNFIMSTTNHEDEIFSSVKALSKENTVFGLYGDFD